MRAVLLASVVLLALASAARAADDPTASLPGVQDLTPATFPEFSSSLSQFSFIEFYAPWCGHCKHLTPEYKKLGAAVAEDAALKSRVRIAKVDADAHRELGEKFGVQGFPTIFYFPRGKPLTAANAQRYEGGRTSSAMLAFIKEQLEQDATFARVESMDALAASFVAAADKQAAIAEAEAAALAAPEADRANAELYVALMRKAAEKGDGWVGTEKARLERLLSSGSLAAGKADEIARKASILGAFVPAA